MGQAGQHWTWRYKDVVCPACASQTVTRQVCCGAELCGKRQVLSGSNPEPC